MVTPFFMKELVNLNKLKTDLIDALKQRTVRVSSIMPDKNSKPVYFRAIGTREMEKVVDEVFANLDIEELKKTEGQNVDIADTYAKELRTLADNLDALRCKIWRTSKEKGVDKESLNDKLFALQSDIRHAADEVSWSYFGD